MIVMIMVPISYADYCADYFDSNSTLNYSAYLASSEFVIDNGFLNFSVSTTAFHGFVHNVSTSCVASSSRDVVMQALVWRGFNADDGQAIGFFRNDSVLFPWGGIDTMFGDPDLFGFTYGIEIDVDTKNSTGSAADGFPPLSQWWMIKMEYNATTNISRTKMWQNGTAEHADWNLSFTQKYSADGSFGAGVYSKSSPNINYLMIDWWNMSFVSSTTLAVHDFNSNITIPTSPLFYRNTTISVNVTDPSGQILNYASINLTFPNGTFIFEDVNLTNFNGSLFNSTPFEAVAEGEYNITVWTNETKLSWRFNISNAPPNATSVRVNNHPIDNDENMSCNYTYVDVENNTEKNQFFRWYNNSVLTSINIQTINSTITSINDSWFCSVLVEDDLFNSTYWFNSTTNIIGDSTGPVIENITSSSVAVTTSDSVTLNFSCDDSISGVSISNVKFSIFKSGDATFDPISNLTASSSAGTYYGRVLSSLSAGNYEFRQVHCSDDSGNGASNTSVSINISVTAPSSGGSSGGGGSSTTTIIQNATVTGICGNKVCEAGFQENPFSCPEDCQFKISEVFSQEAFIRNIFLAVLVLFLYLSMFQKKKSSKKKSSVVNTFVKA